MKRIMRELWFDLREPGLNIWMLPGLSAIFLFVSWWIQKTLSYKEITLTMLEMLIPFLGGYGSLMLMQGLFDTEGGEIYFSYPRSWLYWGVIRQLRFFVVFGFLVCAVCIGVSFVLKVAFWILFPLTLIQSLALMSIAFLGISITKSVSGGLITLCAFTGIQVTLGREYDIFCWIYILKGYVPALKELVILCARALSITAFGLGIGHLWTK